VGMKLVIGKLLDKIELIHKYQISKTFLMDFNLPDLPSNNYTQNLSNPLPTQISLDQLIKSGSAKTSEVSVNEFLGGLGVNNAVLPEKVKIKREEDEENGGGNELK
jgi:hypothetical protein